MAQNVLGKIYPPQIHEEILYRDKVEVLERRLNEAYELINNIKQKEKFVVESIDLALDLNNYIQKTRNDLNVYINKLDEFLATAVNSEDYAKLKTKVRIIENNTNINTDRILSLISITNALKSKLDGIEQTLGDLSNSSQTLAKIQENFNNIIKINQTIDTLKEEINSYKTLVFPNMVNAVREELIFYRDVNNLRVGKVEERLNNTDEKFNTLKNKLQELDRIDTEVNATLAEINAKILAINELNRIIEENKTKIEEINLTLNELGTFKTYLEEKIKEIDIKNKLQDEKYEEINLYIKLLKEFDVIEKIKINISDIAAIKEKIKDFLTKDEKDEILNEIRIIQQKLKVQAESIEHLNFLESKVDALEININGKIADAFVTLKNKIDALEAAGITSAVIENINNELRRLEELINNIALNPGGSTPVVVMPVMETKLITDEMVNEEKIYLDHKVKDGSPIWVSLSNSGSSTYGIDYNLIIDNVGNDYITWKNLTEANRYISNETITVIYFKK